MWAPPVCVEMERGGSGRKEAGEANSPPPPSLGSAAYPPSVVLSPVSRLTWKAEAGHSTQKHALICLWRNVLSPPKETYLKTSDVFCIISSPVGAGKFFVFYFDLPKS